jgi:hypothetical protein
MVHNFLVTSVMSIRCMEVVFVCRIYTLYFLNFIVYFHAVCSEKNRYVSVLCVCVCVFGHITSVFCHHASLGSIMT